MKRFWVAAVAVAFAAAAFAAWGLAAPAGPKRAVSGSEPQSRTGSDVTRPKLPKLPSAVKSRKKWQIGVKCDFPPFGYIDVRGHNDGYDVRVARRFAQLAFGSKKKVELVCVTTPSRIPTLTSGRVDIIISTLTWTADRAKTIDFSIPYYSATGRLLVPNESSIHTVNDLKGKTIVTTRGALYATWTRNCFKDSKLLEVDSPSAATLAVKNGQADTFMFDDAFLLGVATADREVKITKDKFLNIPWGIGIRKGDTATKKWVDAALRRMQAKDVFLQILQRNAPKRLIDDFKDNVPRPGSKFAYPVGKDPTSDCSGI
jgi:polar amino acid transport system substrate-binding protein